jgi:hypothetical protein
MSDLLLMAREALLVDTEQTAFAAQSFHALDQLRTSIR